MATTPQEAAEPRTSVRAWIMAAAVGLGMALVGCLFAVAFLWPLTTAHPKDVGLVLAGPAAATAPIEKALGAQGDAFALRTAPTRADAVAQIERREVAGGIVVGQQGIEVLTASAGGPQVAQLLSQLATGMQAQAAQTGRPIAVTTTDVVPGGSAAGAANLTMIPALIAGLTGSIVGFLMVKRPDRRIATLLTAAATAGLLGSAVLGPWFGILHGGYWAQAGGIALGALAIGAFITGLASLIGRGGLVIGALIIVLFGNPWGGFMVPSEFLARPWGVIGSYLPTGTIITLLRSLSFFPDAPTAGRWWTLTAWAIAGLVMLAGGSVLHRRRNPGAA